MLFSLLSIQLLWQHVKRGSTLPIAAAGSPAASSSSPNHLFVACSSPSWPGGAKVGHREVGGGRSPVGGGGLPRRSDLAGHRHVGPVPDRDPAPGRLSHALVPRRRFQPGCEIDPLLRHRCPRSGRGRNALPQSSGRSSSSPTSASSGVSASSLTTDTGPCERRHGFRDRGFRRAQLASSAQAMDRSRQVASLFLVAIAAFALVAARDGTRDPCDRRKDLLLFTMSVFGLFALAKMVFAVYLGHFGFVLAMPGALVAFAVLVDRLPAKAGRSGSSPAIVRAGAIALVALVVLTHAGTSILSVRDETAPIGDGPDRFMTTPTVARDTAAMLALIDRTVPANETLAVVPEGALLNFLTKRVNPTPYLMLTPTEFANYGETRIVEAFRANPPAAILFVPRAGSQMASDVSAPTTAVLCWPGSRQTTMRLPVPSRPLGARAGSPSSSSGTSRRVPDPNPRRASSRPSPTAILERPAEVAGRVDRSYERLI